MQADLLATLQTELKTFGVAGLGVASRRRLGGLQAPLAARADKAKVLARISAQLEGLLQAPGGEGLIRLWSLLRAVRSVRAAAAPAGALEPLGAGLASTFVSSRGSSGEIARLKALLEGGRMSHDAAEALSRPEPLLSDLRLITKLPAALDRPEQAQLWAAQLLAIGPRAGPLVRLNGTPSGDERRILLLLKLDRTQALSLVHARLSEKPKPKPRVYAAICRVLEWDPDPAAEAILSAAAEGGAQEVRAVAAEVLRRRARRLRRAAAEDAARGKLSELGIGGRPLSSALGLCRAGIALFIR